MVVQQTDAGLLEPVEAENPVHQRGVKELGLRQARLLFRALEDIHVHLLDAVLLLVSRLAPARLVRLSIFVEREQAEHVHVLAREMAVPVARTAARHDYQAAILELVRAERAVEKRNPVQQLEADFADPWTDDDRSTCFPESLELPADGIDRV